MGLPDFGIAGHLINGVVDVNCILDHCAILKHLDLLGHTSNCEVVTVTVELDATEYGAHFRQRKISLGVLKGRGFYLETILEPL